MAEKKNVFIAFAMEDESTRNLFVGQRINARSPFEFVDLSVNEAYETDWKSKVTTRIRRSDGVVVLISSNTPNAAGQLWEISTAVAEGKPLLGVWIQAAYRTVPSAMKSGQCIAWTWQGVADFIDTI